MRIAPLADVKARLSAYLDECAAEGPLVITRNGKAVAVLLVPFDDDDLERLLLGRSARFQALLNRSRQSIKEGQGITEKAFWAAVRKRARRSERLLRATATANIDADRRGAAGFGGVLAVALTDGALMLRRLLVHVAVGRYLRFEMLSPVSTLNGSIRVRLADAYKDGTVWFSLEDSEGRNAVVCIDGRQGSPTMHRLFDLARHPRKSAAILVDLGAPEEGVVVPLLSGWLDSAEPRELGITEIGWELIRDALLRLGEQTLT